MLSADNARRNAIDDNAVATLRSESSLRSGAMGTSDPPETWLGCRRKGWRNLAKRAIPLQFADQPVAGWGMGGLLRLHRKSTCFPSFSAVFPGFFPQFELISTLSTWGGVETGRAPPFSAGWKFWAAAFSRRRAGDSGAGVGESGVLPGWLGAAVSRHALGGLG
jgi:hypothetical protein